MDVKSNISCLHADHFFKEKTVPLGSPHLRLLLTGILTKGTTLGQRGATRDKSPWTEV